jgi:hypothetical protein
MMCPNPHKSVDELRSEQQRVHEYGRGLRGLGQDFKHIGQALRCLVVRRRASKNTNDGGAASAERARGVTYSAPAP